MGGWGNLCVVLFILLITTDTVPNQDEKRDTSA
jgi:hypothetical protein